MGAALVERMLVDESWPGAALVCPVPPSGLLPVLTRLWFGRPDFFWHAQKIHQGMFDPVSLSTLREFGSFVWQFYLPKLPFMDMRIGPNYGYKQLFIERYLGGQFASLEVQYAPRIYTLVQLAAASAPWSRSARSAGPAVRCRVPGLLLVPPAPP